MSERLLVAQQLQDCLMAHPQAGSIPVPASLLEDAMRLLRFQMTFKTLHDINGSRAERWHKPENGGIREWNIAEWTNAMAGEAGEACNAAKKMRRIECGMQQHGGDSGVPADHAEAKRKVLKEVGDTVIYGDLVCQRVGGTLEDAVRMAFNQVSEREGFPERLP